MSRIWIAIFGLVLAGCATSRLATIDPTPLFEDSGFAVRPVPAASDIFAVSAEMERFLAEDLAEPLRRQGKALGLAQALHANGPLKLTYDAGETRGAADTFSRRAGNCLSLVIMTGALARQLDLGVRYYQVHTPDVWSREGDLLLGNQHVNLSIVHRARERRVGDEDFRLSIDFLPPEDLRGQLRSEIDGRRVVAMFLNNRAAEHLVAERLDDAYWSARAALLADARFVPAFNTLGVVYRRAGRMDVARRVFERALEIEPENASILSNLERTLRAQGDEPAAERIAKQLRILEPLPPYHFFFAAIKAMERRDFVAAREAFERELRREPYNHEVHFGLAVALANLGDLAGARRQLASALDSSTTAQSRGLYLAKLERLRALDRR